MRKIFLYQNVYKAKDREWSRRFITESGNYKLISKVTKELQQKWKVIIVINNNSITFQTTNKLRHTFIQKVFLFD